MLISASGATANVRRTPSSTTPSCSGSSRLGVPPPKKTLSTGTLPSRPPHSANSAHNADTYRDTEKPRVPTGGSGTE